VFGDGEAVEVVRRDRKKFGTPPSIKYNCLTSI
jgi:hypothetical protein